MTFLELKNEVKSSIEDPSFDTLVGPYLNDALLEVCELVDLPALKVYSTVTTVLSTAYAALPSNFSRLTFCSYRGEPVKILMGGLETLLAQDPDLDDTGDVTHVAPEGTTLYYTAIPSSAIAMPVVYYREAAQMVADSDVPEAIPAYLNHDVLVARAAMKAWMKIEESMETDVRTNSQIYSALAKQGLTKLRAYASKRKVHTNRSIFDV